MSIVAWKGEMEFAGAAEDDKTGRTVQFKLVRQPEDMIAAHPFSAYTRRRQGRAGTRFEAVFNAITNKVPWTVQCEVMLLHWSDGPNGATVKFLLDLMFNDHPFLSCQRRAKDKAGDGFMAVLAELDDDNTIIDQAKRAHVKRRQQTLSNVAAMFVNNTRFHKWLREEHGLHEGADANDWLKDALSIKSKADLDNDDNRKAIAAFLELKSAFVDWQEENGYDLEP